MSLSSSSTSLIIFSSFQLLEYKNKNPLLRHQNSFWALKLRFEASFRFYRATKKLSITLKLIMRPLSKSQQKNIYLFKIYIYIYLFQTWSRVYIYNMVPCMYVCIYIYMKPENPNPPLFSMFFFPSRFYIAASPWLRSPHGSRQQP
jgi:hypothetical protein